MGRPAVSFEQLLPATLTLTAPAAAVLLVATVMGAFHPLAAFASYAAIFVLSAALLRPYLGDLLAVNQWVRALARGSDEEPPKTSRLPLEETVAAVAQIRRLWNQKQVALAVSARWHETLFDSLPDPLVLLAEGRRVVRLNRAARAAFGRDITGRDLAAVLRDPAVLEAVEAVLAGEKGRETEFTLPVPVERSFMARLERLNDGSSADGTVAILALHDFTTVRRLEQMRADFVANASHELRTPLSTLLGFIETLRGPARDDAEARDRFLGIMFEQASRMARLINDLLSLSRIELNEHSIPSDKVDLAEIIDKAILAMHPLAEPKGMALKADLDRDHAVVAGQADELTQLVQNLLDNAVKYGRDGTPVEVSLRIAQHVPPGASHLRPGTAIAMTVTDHGEGIAREHLPRLTERFYRVDTARSRKLGGTGLGLAIVKHIVNRHRGVLAIDSVLGQGSSFTVYLPLPLPVSG